jgi:hypothetical protein
MVRAPHGQRIAGQSGQTVMLSLRKGIAHELRFDP